MKRIVPAAIASVIILLAACGNESADIADLPEPSVPAAEPSPEPTPTPAPTPTTAAVVSENRESGEIRSSAGDLLIVYDIATPVLDGDLKQINNYYETIHLEQMISINTEMFAAAMREASADGGGFTPYESVFGYEVTYNRDNVLSIMRTGFKKMGGAEAVNYYFENFDTETGELLPIGGLFSVSSDVYIPSIAQLTAQSAGLYSDAQERAEASFDENSYYITDTEINIYWPPGVVSDSAWMITIPLDALSGYLAGGPLA